MIQAAKNQLALPAPSQLRQSQLTAQSYFSADNSKELLTPPASSVVSNINGLASSLMPATPRDLVQKYKNATPACSQVTQHTAHKSVTASQPVIKSVPESEKRPLADCSLYLCGFADEVSELFQNMVRQMGGKCIDLAVDHISNVTHVVIGDSSKSYVPHYHVLHLRLTILQTTENNISLVDNAQQASFSRQTVGRRVLQDTSSAL